MLLGRAPPLASPRMDLPVGYSSRIIKYRARKSERFSPEAIILFTKIIIQTILCRIVPRKSVLREKSWYCIIST
jgi:hypothetical protein